MRVLMLFPYAPLPPPLDLAGTKRNLPFFLELVKYHEVSVLSYGTVEEEKLFRDKYGSLAKEIRFINRRRALVINAVELLWLFATRRSSLRRIYRRNMQRALDEMTSANQYDIIHCCAHMLGFFRFPATVPVSTDTHDVIYDQMHRMAKTTRNVLVATKAYLDYKFGKQEEIELCKKFDLVITATQRDREIFLKDLPRHNVVAIQNGVPRVFFDDVKAEREPFTMVFTGLFTHPPNTEGILRFLNEIFPLILREEPRTRVYVVGKSPPRALLARAADNVIITGFVEDVRPYIARSEVFIIPLYAGGGIRGKALEAMAMRKPIVTTKLGVEGIHLEHGKSALVADTPELFAGAVIRLFRDPGFGQHIADNAFTIVVKEHNWETKGRMFESALRAMVEKRNRK
jgi:glycosyltransferase involved in cell wall biosynthesis